MSGIPDFPRKEDAQSFWDRYRSDPAFRAEVNKDHPIFAGAPVLELSGVISLVDLQTTVAFGRRSSVAE